MPIYTRETLFEDLGVGSDVDMEEGEEAKESSSSRREESSVGTRRPREDDSDVSSSKRSRSGSDRPLADAGDDDDSTPSAAVTSRTNPVRDPWMPSPSEIQSRYGSTSPVGRYALYSCSAINDDDVTKELDFDPAMDQRHDYYIGLFYELRFYGNKKHSRKSKVTEWEALCQSWSAFVENFNRNPAGYRERVRSASERYERFSKRPKILRLHEGAVKAGIPCAVPSGVACAHCQNGAVRLSERDINGYTGISVPVELKTLREKLITQLSSEIAEGERNTQPRAVGNYSSRSSFTPFGGAAGGGIRTPSPFPERRSSGRSAAPTYRGQETFGTQRVVIPADPSAWRFVSMDFIFGLPRDAEGRTGVLIFVDRFSKMVFLAPIAAEVTADESAELFLDLVFRHHGLPESIVSDRDPRFTSAFWTRLFALLGTRLLMSTAAHPETDGQTERANRVLEDVLRSYATYFVSWGSFLPMVEFALNNSTHTSTGLTLFFVNKSRHPCVPALLAVRSSNAAAVSTLGGGGMAPTSKSARVSSEPLLPPSAKSNTGDAILEGHVLHGVAHEDLFAVGVASPATPAIANFTPAATPTPIDSAAVSEFLLHR
ncbi:hypothetical protein PR002_g26305 [Phytophthora rubi]|uniref:Integrase catalytic domain-containing protein n=1 Tax=Phytophthora rubi TaxID=129364 RepID=A0A6A3HRB2_9STRA|nr:hypothetical protein PR002_g26305 [Phytophthora rubi]